MCSSCNNQHETQQKRKAAMTLTKRAVYPALFYWIFFVVFLFQKNILAKKPENWSLARQQFSGI